MNVLPLFAHTAHLHDEPGPSIIGYVISAGCVVLFAAVILAMVLYRKNKLKKRVKIAEHIAKD